MAKKGWQKGSYKKLQKGLVEANNKSIQVGIVSSVKQKSGKRQVYSARVLKWFIEGTRKRQKKWPLFKQFKKGFDPHANGRKKMFLSEIKQGRPHRAYERIGQQASLKMKSLIRQSIKTPSLEPSTVKQKQRKGSRYPTKPGYDSGQMHNNISYKVNRK